MKHQDPDILILILLITRFRVTLEKTPHTREHEVAVFPSEDGAFPQGAKWGDVQSPSTALPVPLQVLPCLL